MHALTHCLLWLLILVKYEIFLYALLLVRYSNNIAVMQNKRSKLAPKMDTPAFKVKREIVFYFCYINDVLVRTFHWLFFS